ncbi:hypothetical protein VCRLGP8_370210 [Vibrio crassostreae]|nr:hypothetical protein VCRLGP107_170209 [Vibrio crassostreae]CDT47570.1 hypothetical protein VCRLGP8_370210 [Vibrio crassostreae]
MSYYIFMLTFHADYLRRESSIIAYKNRLHLLYSSHNHR